MESRTRKVPSWLSRNLSLTSSRPMSPQYQIAELRSSREVETDRREVRGGMAVWGRMLYKDSMSGVWGGCEWGMRRVWVGYEEGVSGVWGGCEWGMRRVWVGYEEGVSGVWGGYKEGVSGWEEGVSGLWGGCEWGESGVWVGCE